MKESRLIQVYLKENKLAKCCAIKLYSNGNTGPVDFQYLADGQTPDPTVCHSSVIKRYAAGEAIEEHAYPNEYYPAPEVIRPKKWCKQQILLIEDTPPYKVSRGLEESITIQPQESQDKLFSKVKKIIALKTDLRAIVTADPDTWTAGQHEALQVRVDEVIGWSA